MDIIMCLTCGAKWTHGLFPDVGGTAAHTHQVEHPDHAVCVGDDTTLLTQVEEAKKSGTGWWQRAVETLKKL